MPMMTSVEADQSDLAEAYDSIYREAHGDTALVPWADGRANPALVKWMNVVAPRLLRCGARVAVVGCGLGEDAREFLRRGYDVTAFDISETAIGWAKQLDPANASIYHPADLFDAPPRWRHRFDLVAEVYTLQSLPPAMREGAMRAMADLLCPHGHALVICRGCETSAVDEDGPPWPLTHDELIDLAASAHLAPIGPIDVFDDDETPPVMRLRGVFRRV